MVLCWIALPIFALLGIFSAKYRKLTKESIECLFRTATFRRCQSGLDDRLRSDVSGKLLKVSPSAARIFYKYYKLIAFIVLIIFIWSAYVSGDAIYNYAKYGNCNGPDANEDDFCVLNLLDHEEPTMEEPQTEEVNQLISCDDPTKVTLISQNASTNYQPCPCHGG